MSEPETTRPKIARVGLYIMVIFILMHSCDARIKLQRIESKLNDIEYKVR